jgi:hypothetical protein
MRMGRKILIVLVLVVLFCSVVMVGYASRQVKQTGVICVLTDRNITEDTSNVDSRNALADWWEVDLVNVLTRRGGYDAKLIQSRDEFVAGPDTYLLTAKIIDYNPGSKAARMFVGFGAGSCSMDLHIELYGVDNKQLFTKDDHVASSRDWRNVARKLNENTLKAVNEALNPARE